MGQNLRYWRPIALSLALVLALSIAGLTACDGGRERRSAPSITDPIVAATVNGKPIYVSDVESEAIVRGLIREGEELDSASDEFYQILEDLIETRLFAMEAEARQLDRNADVRHRLERARELILAGALNEQIRETAVDEASIERMYKDQERLLRRSREVHLRRIVLPNRDSANAAKRRLETGETFEALAYELSVDRSTASEGGDMGFVLPEQLPEALRNAAATTAVKGIAGPIQTEMGWMLLYIEDRREEAPPSRAVMRPRIEQWLLFEEQRRLVERLKSQARIERLVEEKRGFTPQGEVVEPGSEGGAGRNQDVEVPLGPGALAGAAEEGPAEELVLESPNTAPPAGQPKAAPPAAAPQKAPAQKAAPPARVAGEVGEVAPAPRKAAPKRTPPPTVEEVLPPVRDAAPPPPIAQPAGQDAAPSGDPET